MLLNRIIPVFAFLLSFTKFLEDISPFRGATDTPILDFWWRLPRVSKPGWIPSLACFLVCAQQIPQIYLWCNTCWLYRGQHGSQAFLIHVPADMSASIGGGVLDSYWYFTKFLPPKLINVRIFTYFLTRVPHSRKWTEFFCHLEYAIHFLLWVSTKIKKHLYGFFVPSEDFIVFRIDYQHTKSIYSKQVFVNKFMNSLTFSPFVRRMWWSNSRGTTFCLSD